MDSKHQTILVTGGAGYIGAHFVNALRKSRDCQIEIVDIFTQSRKNIIKAPNINYHEVDIRNKPALLEVFKKTQPDIIVHFAALASVPESVEKPFEYYDTNILGSFNLLECMRAANVKKIIFSSSAAVYGEPEAEEIKENHRKNPTNPYGRTKLIFEGMLEDHNKAYGLNSISLRYFCAAGCDKNLEIGEYHEPESHVIPCIIQTILGKREQFFVFGNDYPTPDGTGIRDYIHVSDLAEAHLLAMEKLSKEENVCAQYNLGINKGFSVMELIKAAEEVAGKKVNFAIKPRRPGDPSKLIADSSLAQKELNWQPRYTGVKEIIETSYKFFSSI